MFEHSLIAERCLVPNELMGISLFVLPSSSKASLIDFISGVDAVISAPNPKISNLVFKITAPSIPVKEAKNSSNSYLFL